MDANLPFCYILGALPGSRSSPVERLELKLLASSLLRNLPLGEVHVLRSGDGDPLFRVGREGLIEHWGQEMPQIDASRFSWIFYIASGSLALREIDHLLDGDCDIFWAPLPQTHLVSSRTQGYLSDEEMRLDRTEFPWSRPWRSAASSAAWAVRGEHFGPVMDSLKDILVSAPKRSCDSIADSAWNRFLLDSPLKVKRFERDEIAFPSFCGEDCRNWSEAALINVSDFPPALRITFLQAWFYSTYLGDPGGLFLDILEP